MGLAQEDEMVHGIDPISRLLPGRGWCGRLVPDAHGAQSVCDDGAVDPIPIANEMLRGIQKWTLSPSGTRLPRATSSGFLLGAFAGVVTFHMAHLLFAGLL